MSQIEDHYEQVAHIEAELKRYMIALGLDWHDETAMRQLAAECKVFGPAQAQAAYASHEQRLITRAQLFALISLMLRTMESAALQDRDVHGGEVWKAVGRHFYT